MRASTWVLASSIAALVGAVACSSGSSGGSPGGSSGSSSGSSGWSSGSGDAGGTITVSCDESSTNTHICFERHGLTAAEADQENASCVMGKGTVGTGCADTNLLGTCPAPVQTIYYYCGDVSAYETDCMLYKGTWMPGTGGQATCGDGG